MTRPRVVYVSYDGAGEPLGRSQVVAYLVRLARSCDITLVSFEKDRASRPETAAELRRAGISWVPCSYRRRPPVLSTLWDVLAGARAVRRACRETGAEIVHVRSYVPALIALLAAWPGGRGWKLLFDIRGFWADERVLAGAWKADSRLYRFTKRCERRFFAEADAVVTLTEASVPRIRDWLEPRQVPVRVIPTCADVERFGGIAPGEGPRAVWCGSIGTVYRFELAVRFAEALRIPFLVLTRQVDAARELLGDRGADVREVAHSEISRELRPGDVGLCFYADGGEFGNLGRAPTRVAEYLAAGMVVAITPRIGDMDSIVEGNGLGVRIEDESEAGLAEAAARALRLAADPEVRARGQRLAAELFSVDDGAEAYLGLYRELQRGAGAVAGTGGREESREAALGAIAGVSK